VAPASLLAKWAAEIERFAPSLRALIAHPSSAPAEKRKAYDPADLGEVDLVINELRVSGTRALAWRHAVADRHYRRSPGHQESNRQTDQASQSSQSRDPHA